MVATLISVASMRARASARSSFLNSTLSPGRICTFSRNPLCQSDTKLYGSVERATLPVRHQALRLCRESHPASQTPSSTIMSREPPCQSDTEIYGSVERATLPVRHRALQLCRESHPASQTLRFTALSREPGQAGVRVLCCTGSNDEYIGKRPSVKASA